MDGYRFLLLELAWRLVMFCLRTCWLIAALVGFQCSAAAPTLASGVATPVHRPSETWTGGESRALQQIQSYAMASFRNAGIPASQRSDSAQQLVLEMLQRCPRHELAGAADGQREAARRELNRAVWRIVKRWKRQRNPQSLPANSGLRQLAAADRRTHGWRLEELQALPGAALSPSQSAVLRLLCQGYSHEEIAEELNMTKPQVSQEKYRALQKLRQAWLDSELA